jgi:hypothetical protein
MMIKNSISISDGEIQAFTFRGKLTAPVKDFSAGLGFGYEPLNHNTLGSRISNIAAQQEPCIYLVDDVMGTKQDILQSKNAIIIGNEVYHVITNDEISTTKIDNIMLTASVSWHALATLVKGDSTAQLLSYLNTGKTPPEIVIEVIIGAFDGEGYLHWRSRQSLPKEES